MKHWRNLSSVLEKNSTRAVLGAIFFYRRVVSLEHGVVGSAVRPLLPSGFFSACRFFPSCSAYAEGALRQYGLLWGGMVLLGRIGRCHPWHAGGYDPLKIPNTKHEIPNKLQ
ncbi:MAG: membrane protein insertion efficiency factor YidD [Patescibacteria group bacterium]